MGFLGKLFNGPGNRVEEIIMYLVDVETKKIQYYLSHKNRYKSYSEYCQSRTSIILENNSEKMTIEEWIVFETVLRIFRKISKTELVEYRDFNYENEIVGMRIYNEEVGHIVVESFLDRNKKRVVEVSWQDEFNIK